MQKQFLLNTLLLIGAICLSTRGMAQTTPEIPTTEQTQSATIETTQPVNTTTASVTTAPTQQQTNYSTPTSTYAPANEDATEEMD